MVIVIKDVGVGKLDDRGGLRLDKTADSAGKVARYTFAGMRREIGLGSADALMDVTFVDGTTQVIFIEVPVGRAKNPMERADHDQKFRELTQPAR